MTVVAAYASRHRDGGSGGGSANVPRATTMTIVGDTSVIVTHATAPIVVTVYDQYLSPMAGQTPTITTTNALIASLSTDPDTGIVTALGVSGGQVTISATLVNSQGQTIHPTSDIALVVSPQVTTLVTVTPPTVTIPDSGSASLSAVVTDQATPAFPIAGAVVTWSRTGTKYSVNVNTGVITGAGTGAGSGIVTASCGSATPGTCAVTVTAAASVVTTVAVTPSSATIQAGGTVDFNPVIKDQYTNVMPLEGATWGGSNDLIATVDAGTGVATGVSAGTVTITATSITDPTKTGTATLTIGTPQVWLPQVGDTIVLDMTPGGAQDLQNVNDVTTFKNKWPDRLQAGGTGTPQWTIVVLDDGTHVVRFTQTGWATRTIQQAITADPVNAQTVLVSSTGGMTSPRKMGIGWDPVTQTSSEAPTVTVISQTTISAIFTQNHSIGDKIAYGFDGGAGNILTGVNSFGTREFFISFDLYMGALAIDSVPGRQGVVGSNYSSFNRSIGSTFNYDATKAIGAGRKFGTCTKIRQDSTPNRVGDYWDGGPSAATFGWAASRTETDALWSAGRGSDYAPRNTATSTNPAPLNPDDITFRWVRVTKHFKSESDFIFGDGAAAVYVDPGDGGGTRLWYGSEACRCGTEPWLNLQIWATWNSPLYPTTDYMKGFKMWSRPWVGAVPPGKPNAMTKLTDTGGSVTVTVNLPSANCDTIRFYSADGGYDKFGNPALSAIAGGQFHQLGTDIAVAPSDLGTTKQYTVAVPAGAITLVSHSYGNGGRFGEPSTPITESNPNVTTPPNAPTATASTSGTGNSLTFPVTTSASGATPSFIVPEFDTTGSGNWVAQADVACSVAQGNAQNVTVTGLSAATVYTNRFRFSSKNAAGTSSASSTVSGTTVGQALAVTGGSQTLINKGHLLLDITDGTNPVAGCTVTPTDTSKCDVYSGYTLFGKADSGSTTVTISKGGYTSAVITITCSALDLVITGSAGTSTTTDGAALASWTSQDPSATVYSEATNRPLYESTSVNSLPGVTFDGTNDKLQTSAAVSALNQTAVSIFSLVKPNVLGDSRASGRQWLGNLNNASFRGFHLQLNSANNFLLTVCSGTASAAITSSGTYTGGTARKFVATIASGAQVIRAGGAQVGTGTLAYAPNTSIAGTSLGANFLGNGNFWYGDIVMTLVSARLWTGAEIAQLELMGTNVYGV